MGQGEGKQVPEQDLFDVAMEMRMASKSIQKEANKAEKQEMMERKKVADLIKAGKKEIAQIHAETAIMHHKDAVGLTRLSAQMSAVENQIKAAERTQHVSATMQHCVPGMKCALQKMNDIGIAQSMDAFNDVFETMGVKAAAMGEVIDQTTGSAVDQKAVDKLLEEVSAQQAMEIGGEMGAVGSHKMKQKEVAKVPQDLDDYEKRLNELKQ